MSGKDPWREAREGFEKWFKLSCYLYFVWIFLDILPYLPTQLVDRIIEAILRKLGI